MQRYKSQTEYDGLVYMFNLHVRCGVGTFFSNVDSSHKYPHRTIGYMQRFMLSNSNSDLMLRVSARIFLGADEAGVWEEMHHGI
jgi:hypothetical protein